MSLKNLLQEMKGEWGSLSRKGLGKGMMRSRTQRVVQDSLIMETDKEQSCWANLPPELLRDVLMRLEKSEASWPCRKTVVACAGVCSTWRLILKDIVLPLHVSGQLTFPISLKQPGPKGSLVHCYIKRNRSKQTYHLFLALNQTSNEDGKFLFVAKKIRRTTCTDYIISLNCNDVSRGSNSYCIGKLRSNFLGSRYTVYDAHPTSKPEARVSRSFSTRPFNSKQVNPRIPTENYAVAHISFDLNGLGPRGPRRMECVMCNIPKAAMEGDRTGMSETELVRTNLESFPSTLVTSQSTRVQSYALNHSPSEKEGLLVLKNKSPRWHEQLQCWCLNFNGRVTVASVKNFQLVAETAGAGAGGEGDDDVIVQFGKVGKDLFTMDYQFPISAFQAFAICLSSFDTKIACE